VKDALPPTSGSHYCNAVTDDRSYDDRQVAKILRRATELQSRGPEVPGKTSGFSLADLEEIALEAGIDPTNIRRAAEDLESGQLGASDWSIVFGAPLTLRVERDVQGEMSDFMFDEFLVEIQNAGIGHGQPSVVGNTLTWRSGGAQNVSSLQVTVSARDGRTEIRAEERRHQAAGGLFGGIVGGGGVGLGIGTIPLAIEALNSPALAVVLPIAVLGIAYGVARTIFGKTGKQKKAKLTRLVDKIAERCRVEISRRQLGESEGRGTLPEPLK